LPWEFEHTLQAFNENILAGLAGATTVVRKEGRDNFRERIRLLAELDENGRKQVTGLLLATFPEVEVKYRNCGQSHLTHVMNLFDDG
jgi:hypothetical protein